MYKIQTLNKISAIGTDIFDKSKYSVAEDIANPDAIMVRSAKMHDMQFGDNLLAIARAGAGVNNIPVERCAQEGICVFNTPGANSNAVKELAICALLLASRKIVEAASWAASLKGTPDAPKTVEGGKSKFAGPEIAGKTLGIIGLGAIGGKIANAAESLGMKVIGYDPFLSVGAALHLEPSVQVVKDINDCFFHVIHTVFSRTVRNHAQPLFIAGFRKVPDMESRPIRESRYFHASFYGDIDCIRKKSRQVIITGCCHHANNTFRCVCCCSCEIRYLTIITQILKECIVEFF